MLFIGGFEIKYLSRKFVKLFSSVKLAISLLFLLVVVMIIGTVLPQNQNIGRYIGLYGQFFANVIVFLGLDDVFHSPLFISLMGIFGLNLLTCSLNRLRGLKTVLFSPRVKVNKSWIKSLDNSKVVKAGSKKREEIASTAKNFLKDRNYKLFEREESEKKFYLFQKGKWGQIGPEIVHLSLILILVGGIIGGLTGFSTQMKVAEGNKKLIPHTENYLKLKDFSIAYYDNRLKVLLYRQVDGEYKFDKKLILKTGNPKTYKNVELEISKPSKDSGSNLSFTAQGKEDKITVEVTKKKMEAILPNNIGAILVKFIKEYSSQVVILNSDGEGINETLVQVNHPLSTGGFTLYQQAYELGSEVVLDPKWVTLKALHKTKDGFQRLWKKKIGLGNTINSGPDATITPTKFYPNLAVNQTGEAVNMSNAPDNPAVYLKVNKTGQKEGSGDSSSSTENKLNRWIFQRYGDIHYSSIVKENPQAVKFTLDDFGPVTFTGDKSIFTVNRKPGVPLIYAGFGLLTLGLILSFFVFHKRIWLGVDTENGEVVIGGRCSKKVQNFQNELNDLYKAIDSLKKGGTSE